MVLTITFFSQKKSHSLRHRLGQNPSTEISKPFRIGRTLYGASNVYLRPRFNAFGASNVYLRPRFNAFGAKKDLIYRMEIFFAALWSIFQSAAKHFSMRQIKSFLATNALNRGRRYTLLAPWFPGHSIRLLDWVIDVWYGPQAFSIHCNVNEWLYRTNLHLAPNPYFVMEAR